MSPVNRSSDSTTSASPSGPTSAGGRVGWQVDIPNLANIVTRVGIEGLKRLSLSGIDIHTLGCVLALGEVTPASIEFRSEIQNARYEQRAERWWIHSIVEYGSGSNFLVDELLKTRARENFLSLTTAVASILDDATEEVFSLLYEKLGASPYNTPSLDQIKKIRSACLPLARKMQFKDYLAGTFNQLSHLFDSDRLTRDAIPDPNTMAELIKATKDVAMQEGERKLTLIFYGVTGAAWLAVYSYKILAIPVCVVLKDGIPRPLFPGGTYNSSAVFIFPDQDGSVEMLQKIERTSDVIVLRSSESLTTSARLCWQVSCGMKDGVDLIELVCKWNIRDRKEMGNLIYSIACDYIKERLSLLNEKKGGSMPSGSVDDFYYGRNIGTFVGSLEEILRMFGFTHNLDLIETWHETQIQDVWGIHDGTGLQSQFVNSRSAIELQLKLFSRMIAHKDQQYDGCGHEKLQPKELEYLPRFCVRCRLLLVVANLSWISSILAFTDWSESFKRVSIARLMDLPGNENIARLQSQMSRKSRPEFSPWSPDLEDSKNIPNELSLHRDSLAQQISQLCSGSFYAEDVIQSNQHKFLGVNVDGMLLIDYRAVEQSLKPGPIFLIREGDFSLHGDRRPILTCSRNEIWHGSTDEKGKFTSLKPWNQFEGRLSLSTGASLRRDSIELHYTIAYKPSHPIEDESFIEGEVKVLNIMPALESLLITQPCQHPPETSLPVTRVEVEQNSDESDESVILWKDDESNFWQIEENLLGKTLDNPGQNVTHYMPVANNQLAQWAAMAFQLRKWARQIGDKDDRTTFDAMILQDRACLACTRYQAYWRSSRERPRPKNICIISGRCP
ncbi:MAG: hypothetical protein Q9227_000738 [Pyrenula ochraceoflavens]